MKDCCQLDGSRGVAQAKGDKRSKAHAMPDRYTLFRPPTGAAEAFGSRAGIVFPRFRIDAARPALQVVPTAIPAAGTPRCRWNRKGNRMMRHGG